MTFDAKYVHTNVIASDLRKLAASTPLNQIPVASTHPETTSEDFRGRTEQANHIVLLAAVERCA